MSSFQQQQAALNAATRRLAAEVTAAEAADALSRSRRQTAEAEAALTAKLTQLDLAQREFEEEALAIKVLAPLPTDLVRLVFLLLPVDARLRCCEVCRGWRAFLSDSFLWRVCDLSARSGVVAYRTPALLHAAYARAQGTLEVLDVTGCRGFFDEVGTDEDGYEKVVTTLQVLQPVLRANAGSLVELHTWDCFEPTIDYYLCVEYFEALLSAAPRLRLLECDAGAGEEAATTLRLLEEPQFAPVRLRAVCLSEQVGFPLDVPAAAAQIALHTFLVRLELYDVALDTQPALDAVVVLAVSQLQHLTMDCCRLLPASLSALTRMLGSGSLTELYISNDDAPLIVGAAVPAFCAALRASRLVGLTLGCVDLWDSLEDSLAVIAACTGHPTLRALDFKHNRLHRAPGREAIEAALDALTASNAELSVNR